MQPKPDCCAEPDLELVRRLEDPPGRERDLRRCRCCGAWWRVEAEERMNFGGGEDYYWEWYMRLTAEEAGL